MTPTEILHEIVTAEREAQKLYNDAVKARDGFEDSVKSRITDMRLEYFRTADQAIAKHERDEIRAADAAILANDALFSGRLKAAAEFYETNKDMIAERIFGIVVAGDA